MRNSRAARRALSGIGEALDPNRGLRQSAENLEVADTADNRRHLAEERMKRGQWAEAEALYRAALVGPLADDPALLIGLAKALSGRGDHQGAYDALETLYRDNPNYELREARLIQARALDGLGRTREAADAWRALIGYTTGPEAQVRYGLMMKKLGDAAACPGCLHRGRAHLWPPARQARCRRARVARRSRAQPPVIPRTPRSPPSSRTC